MFKEKENVYSIGNHTISEVNKVKKNTINSIKKASGYIYADDNSKISVNGNLDETLYMFSFLCNSLLQIFSKEELKKIIDITNKIKLAENDELKNNEAFDELAEVVKKIYEKNVKKIRRGEDISIK